MQDAQATQSQTNATSTIELLQQEIQQLKQELAWVKTEYHKLLKTLASPNKPREKHLSPGATPWLPFDNAEELEQAKRDGHDSLIGKM